MADEAAIRDLVGKMQYERKRLLALLSTLDEDEAGRPPRFSINRNTGREEGDWTAKEQMAHLSGMEASYRAWVERALAEDGANVAGVRGESLPITMEDANLHSLAELIELMVEQRRKTMDLIARLRPEDYGRTATNSNFGTLTLLQWLRSYYRHDRQHCDQIAGREPEFRPRFVSGVEPDQRVHRRTFVQR